MANSYFDFIGQNAGEEKKETPQQTQAMANVTVRCDADCFLLCDGEYLDIQLGAGKMAKIQVPIGQHLLEFLYTEDPDIKIEKEVDFPESGKSYLVIIKGLKDLVDGANAEAQAKAAEEEAKRKAKEKEAKRKAEAEAKRKAEEEAKRKAEEEEAKRKAEAEAKRKAEEEAKRKAKEKEAKRKAEAKAKRKAEEEAKRKAEEEEAKRKAEAEAKRKAEEEARRKAEEELRILELQKEPYAVLSNNNATLTFYYDHLKSNRNGMNIEDRKWVNHKADIVTVFIDESFANCHNICSTRSWFWSCENLTSVVGLNNLDTSKVTDMNSMFCGCKSLQSLDLSNFDTRKVTDMRSMFGGCNSLQSLDLSSFDTSNVTTMNCMFCGCKSLQSLDLSSFDTSKVTDMDYMFYGCTSLRSLDLSSFDTSKGPCMLSMFKGCPIDFPKNKFKK